jgi:hypothetical protein
MQMARGDLLVGHECKVEPARNLVAFFLRPASFHRSRGLVFGTNGVPTIRTGSNSAALTTVCLAAGADGIKSGAGFDSIRLAAPTAAKPTVNPVVIRIRRVWSSFMSR